MTRIAIIGTGGIVGSHLTAIKAAGERAELVAAVDVDEARERAVCAENSIPRWYCDARAMLETEQPDLVQIATPPAIHKKLIVDCLEAGAWVYCEKPLCSSLAEFDDISRAEERTGRYVSTVFQWRFGSAGKHVKRLIADGTLGRPLVGVCNTLWY
ncbi:MAG: Gfo/Idh/MocA family oxidoreductase, partial [Anaerolineae bacterium]|nr:Gfo/Idh/MocA family oxidoreductase [Anaerolineae bacterium]